MQEDTVLDLTPLGINGKSAIGHSGKRIWLRTCLIHIPALKHIACWNSRRCVGVVTAHIRTVFNARFGSDLSCGSFACYSNIITIIISTIHEVDGVGRAGIIHIN